jgi:hypothetical protein
MATTKIEKIPKKVRSGLPAPGVEEIPEAGCPLDPEPGLGGTFSIGPFPWKSRAFLQAFLL